MARTKIKLCLPVALAILAGCAPHTIDTSPQPQISAPAAFSAGETGPVSRATWYRAFADPALDALVTEALGRNLDVTQARARLAQAGFLSDAASAARLPQVDLTVDTDLSRVEGGDLETMYGAGAALDWEVDAFNRLGSVASARSYEEQAAAADVEAVRLSLSAEVAEAYFSAVADNVRLRLLREQSDSDSQLLDLVRQRYDAGIGTQVDVLQQQSRLADNDALIPVAEASLRTFENRLDVLLGTAPDGADRVPPASGLDRLPDLPAVGVPSDLLLNRPDLRALQALLVAQDAEIAAAIAERLPRITLSGSFLLAAGPDAGAGYAASALAGLVQPLLDWGARKAEVERNRALYQERLAAFTQAYLEAMEDVENALYQETKQREHIRLLEERRRLLSETLSAADAVYRQGESDYLPVLSTLRELRVVERDLIAQKLNLVLYRIRLHRALGGALS